MVNRVLPVKRGISSPAVISIPENWDRQWFRYFIDNFLSGSDIRNVTASGGITVSGNVSGDSTIANPSGQVVISQAPIINNTVLGNISGAIAVPVALTQTQLTTLINVFTSGLAGDVPPSGGGTVNFLRADGTWANPGGLTAIPNNTVLGNVSGGSAVPIALTQTQLTALINVFTSGLSGSVPASGGGTTTFLRADTSFAVPPNFTSTTPGYVPLSGGGTVNFLRADGTFSAPPTASSANPSALVGPVAINGAAATFMTSDSAPGQNLSAAYTWGGVHTYNARIAAQQGLTVSGNTFISRGITDNALTTALTISNVQAISTFAPTSGNISLTVNGNGAVALSVISGLSSVAAGADLRVTRAGSTANQAGQGANVFINDTTNLQGYYLQSSGQQFELWSSAGAGPTLTQILKVPTTGGLALNAATGGADTLTLTPGTTGNLMAINAGLTNNAGASAGTLTNAPAIGNPTKWIKINDNGTIRSIPAW